MNPKRPLIGPELKDKLIDFLIKEQECHLNKLKHVEKKSLKAYFNNIDADIIWGLFDQLEKDGLLSSFAENFASFSVYISSNAFEFKRLGAYQAQEELINKQLVLLNAQLKELQSKNVISSSDSIVSTISGLTNIIGQVFNKFG